jgi:hypothetical protein
MFRILARNLQTFRQTATSRVSYFARQARSGPGLRRTAFAAFPLFMYTNSHVFCLPLKEQEQKIPVPELGKVNPRLLENPRTPWEKVKSLLSHILRMVQLLCIFLPPLLFFPLKLSRHTERLWLKLFVWSVERAGVVWIKAFQYLSHRRDVIGPEMA